MAGERNFRVRACVCYGQTFRELKALAELCEFTTVEEITTATGCGSGCGLCRPYLARMLRTGETEIPLMVGTELGNRD